MSSLGLLYERVYSAISGTGARLWPWHFQWLAVYTLHKDLRDTLGGLRNLRLLDVGCGSKPYNRFLHQSVTHIGVDIAPGPMVDQVIDGRSIPYPTGSFDAILCTQVLEHAAPVADLRDEMLRCLKPGGLLIATVPFLYHAHGAPWDFRRMTRYGARQFFEDGLLIQEVRSQGGIGSTIGILLLGWYEAMMNRHWATRIAKGVLLPAFLIVTFVVNLIGWILDRLDRTGDFYNNVMIVGTRRPVEQGGSAPETEVRTDGG